MHMCKLFTFIDVSRVLSSGAKSYTLTYEHQNYVACPVELNLLDPVSHRVKGRPSCDVVGNDSAMSAAVVTLGDCAEPFLARCVPHLYLLTHTYMTRKHL